MRRIKLHFEWTEINKSIFESNTKLDSVDQNKSLFFRSNRHLDFIGIMVELIMRSIVGINSTHGKIDVRPGP